MRPDPDPLTVPGTFDVVTSERAYLLPRPRVSWWRRLWRAVRRGW